MEKLNLQYLNELMDGNTEIIHEVLKLFKAEVPKDIERLKQTLAEGNFDQLGKIAHKLKSSVGNLGLSVLKDEFYFIEQSGKNNQNIEQMPEAVENVIQKLENVFLQIDEEINQKN